MAINIKSNRIDFRISEENKNILEEAAKINNLSLSSYILSVVMKQAKIDIENNEILKLNNKDKDLIMNLLNDSLEPNDNLIKLMKL